MTRRTEGGLDNTKKPYLWSGMRYVAFILGTSLGLGWLLAKPVEAVVSAGTTTAVVSQKETKAALKEAKQQKAEKASFWARLKNFFGGLGKLGWGPFSLIILAILTPPLAVGIASDWNPDKVLIAILLTILCYIPGLIYALIEASK
jgi:uncharacterized membrane protein YqaE (UPF0057 family)